MFFFIILNNQKDVKLHYMKTFLYDIGVMKSINKKNFLEKRFLVMFELQ